MTVCTTNCPTRHRTKHESQSKLLGQRCRRIILASLEKDVLLRTRFATKAQARWAVVDYIDNFYNPIRKHSYNGQLSPQIAEQLFFQQQDAAYTEFSTPLFRINSKVVDILDVVDGRSDFVVKDDG